MSPLVTTYAGAGVRPYGFGGGAGELSWSEVVTAGATASYMAQVAVNSTKEVLLGGFSQISATYSNTYAKFNASGVLQWQFKIDDNGNTQFGTVDSDSSGNFYIATIQASSTIPTIYKINSSNGSVAWQFIMNTSYFSGA
jgi:hypothetical protein